MTNNGSIHSMSNEYMIYHNGMLIIVFTSAVYFMLYITLLTYIAPEHNEFIT